MTRLFFGSRQMRQEYLITTGVFTSDIKEMDEGETERESAGECQISLNMAEHGAKGLVKCTYSFVGGKQRLRRGAGG